MARKVRSWEKGSFSSPVTSTGGKAVTSVGAKPVMSRSFSKPKAAPAARASAPRKSKGKVTNRPTPGGAVATSATPPKITTTKLSPASTGRGRGDGLQEMVRRSLDRKVKK